MKSSLPSSDSLPGDKLDPAKMPGHWLLARMGKKVLRPGGLELTRELLDGLSIEPSQTVVELAPGLGTTARMSLKKKPAHYVGVERDHVAAERVRHILRGSQDRCVTGSADKTGLENESADVVYGEAMLTMQAPSQKSKIVSEAFRILKPGGRYGIHELALQPDNLDEATKSEILQELSSAIRVGARPLTVSEWSSVLRNEGFEVNTESSVVRPMHLLEPLRVIQDEGLLGAMKIAFNVIRTRAARRRIFKMRNVFQRYRNHLCAVAIVATKPAE